MIFVAVGWYDMHATAQPIKMSPVYHYNASYFASYFRSPPPQHNETLQEMVSRGALRSHGNASMTHCADAGHSVNNVFNIVDVAGALTHPDYLLGTTFWIHEFMHVGHVFYDIALVEVLQITKIDRVVLQRAACHDKLCYGNGTFESFFKGYYGAALKAGGQLHVPVYMRYDGNSNKVNPMYYSESSPSLLDEVKMKSPLYNKPIQLQNVMYFERLLRKTNIYSGEVAPVSALAAEKFKDAAYSFMKTQPPLTTYFQNGSPYEILFSYRGSKGSTHRTIANYAEIAQKLKMTFPSPDYRVVILDNSNMEMSFDFQVRTVQQAHVVLTNHGAFELNLIFMRKNALLVEMVGNYPLTDSVALGRLAVSFNLHYGNQICSNLTEHEQSDFYVSSSEISELIGTVQDYFVEKPYLNNQAL